MNTFGKEDGDDQRNPFFGKSCEFDRANGIGVRFFLSSFRMRQRVCVKNF